MLSWLVLPRKHQEGKQGEVEDHDRLVMPEMGTLQGEGGWVSRGTYF